MLKKEKFETETPQDNKEEYDIYLIDNNSTKLGHNSKDSLVYNEGSTEHSSGMLGLLNSNENEEETMGQYQQYKGNIVAGGGYSSDTHCLQNH